MSRYRNIRYETAQICEDGHVITIHAKGEPATRRESCPKCGKPTFTACPSCGAFIPGCEHDYYTIKTNCDTDHVVSLFDCCTKSYEVPKYCHGCGKPYPWLAGYIDEFNLLLEDIDNISDEQKEILKKSFPNLLSDNVHYASSALEFAPLLNKLHGVAGELLRDLLKKAAIDKVCDILQLT